VAGVTEFDLGHEETVEHAKDAKDGKEYGAEDESVRGDHFAVLIKFD